jgi:crossover junction endodeoxyribonuclease RuvC
MTDTSVRILGIDPGLRFTGYGCIDSTAGGQSNTVVEAGVIRIPQKRPLPERLAYLHRELISLMQEVSPDLVMIEQVFVHRDRAQTAMQMGHARGVMLLAAEQQHIEIDDLSPAEIKRAVTGNGRASKEQVQHAVATLLNLSGPPDQADAADALAIALAAAARRPA